MTLRIPKPVLTHLKTPFLCSPLASLCSQYLNLYYSHLQWRQWHTGSPEWFDHRIDFFRWSSHLNPHWAERGIYSKEVMFEGCKVLDIASGDGFYAKYFYLSTKAYRIDCIDINNMAIGHARRLHNDQRIRYFLSDAIRDTFPDTKYDVVCCDGAIDHFSIDDIGVILKKSKMVLGNDGVFTGYQELGHHELDSEHPSCFVTEDDVVALFGNYFEYVKILITHTPERVNCYVRCSDSESKMGGFR